MKTKERIEESLDIIMKEEEGRENFVIFTLLDNTDYYVQVAGEKDGKRLWVEAASIQNIEESQKEELASLGWQRPEDSNTMNFSRLYKGNVKSMIPEVAAFILATPRIVYGFKAQNDLQVELNLE